MNNKERKAEYKVTTKLMEEVDKMQPLQHGSPLSDYKEQISISMRHAHYLGEMYSGSGFEVTSEIALSEAQKVWLDKRVASSKGSEPFAAQLLTVLEKELSRKDRVAEALDLFDSQVKALIKVINE